MGILNTDSPLVVWNPEAERWEIDLRLVYAAMGRGEMLFHVAPERPRRRGWWRHLRESVPPDTS